MSAEPATESSGHEATAATAEPAIAVAEKPDEVGGKAVLRSLARTSKENREMKAKIADLEKLTANGETTAKTLAEKEAMFADLQARMAEFEETAAKAPHLLLRKYGHGKSSEFFKEIVDEYTTSPKEEDPKLAALSKGLEEVRGKLTAKEKAEAEAETKKADDEKLATEKKSAAELAEREKAAIDWADTFVTAEEDRWAILSASADLRHFAALKVLREAGEAIKEKGGVDDAEADKMFKDGMDQMETFFRNEQEPLYAAMNKVKNPAKPKAEINDPGVRVFKRDSDTPVRIRPGISSERAAFDRTQTKVPMSGGPRRLGMPKEK